MEVIKPTLEKKKKKLTKKRVLELKKRRNSLLTAASKIEPENIAGVIMIHEHRTKNRKIIHRGKFTDPQ